SIFPSDAAAKRAALTTILSRKGRAADLTRRSVDAESSDPKQQRRARFLAEIAALALGKSQPRSGSAKERAWALQQEVERLDRELNNDATVTRNVPSITIEAAQQRL